MKKSLLLTLIISTLILQNTNAQLIKDIGLKTGVTFSTENWTYGENNEMENIGYRTGFNIAANLEWFNHEYFTLITHLGYIEKGYTHEIMMTTEDDPTTGQMKSFDTRFDYLYFSPQLKVRKEFNKIIPYIFVGPRIDYHLSYKSDFDFSTIEDDFEDIIYGLNYGIGIEFRQNNMGLSLEFANVYDFNDMLVIEASQIYPGLAVHNNAYTIDVGFRYYFE